MPVFHRTGPLPEGHPFKCSVIFGVKPPKPETASSPPPEMETSSNPDDKGQDQDKDSR